MTKFEFEHNDNIYTVILHNTTMLQLSLECKYIISIYNNSKYLITLSIKDSEIEWDYYRDIDIILIKKVNNLIERYFKLQAFT